MYNQTNYLFFNLLICGLLISEFFHKNNRSQRLGLALGLIVIGLIPALRLPQSKRILREEGFRIGGTVLLLISLTCTGELVWGEIEFKLILMALLLLLGLLLTWAQGALGNLPATFWLLVSAGAVIATFVFEPKAVDLGAYLGAWSWIVLDVILNRLLSKTIVR